MTKSCNQTSSYVAISKRYPDSNKHRLCKCLPSDAYDTIGIYGWGYRVDCPGGRSFNCTEGSDWCKEQVCSAPELYQPRNAFYFNV